MQDDEHLARAILEICKGMDMWSVEGNEEETAEFRERVEEARRQAQIVIDRGKDQEG
jgi:coenzyme F420-reducing hydrogenase gamma subunit